MTLSTEEMIQQLEQTGGHRVLRRLQPGLTAAGGRKCPGDRLGAELAYLRTDIYGYAADVLTRETTSLKRFSSRI